MYSIKELAELIKPGQLGIRLQDDMFLFRPCDPHSPLVEALVDRSNWFPIKNHSHILKSCPTLENYYDLEDSGLEFYPTSKVQSWYLSFGTQELDWSREPSKDHVLFDYQKEAAAFLSWRDRAMLSLSPGLGKTLTSAYAAGLKNFCRVLVVCPASLLFYWKGELTKWESQLPHSIGTLQIWHRKIDVEHIQFRPHDQDWFITNPETITKHLDILTANSHWFDCLIVDESIMYKHANSRRSKALKKLAESIPTVWLLTGAPATRYLDDFWHQFHILKPKGYPSYWRFTRKYCVVHDDEWGSKVVANRSKAEEKIKRNFADIYFSRTQDDVADIPDWIMEDIDIPMLPKQDKAYETLREELYIRLESIDPAEVITVNNHLSLMVRSVQVASNPILLGGVDEAGKWEALSELMDIYPGPYLIWVNFIETGKLLRTKLALEDMRVALANGSTPMEDRNQMVNAFQKGELDVLILNNQVGKFGFTLTEAKTAFFVERMYDDSYFQCLHRNRRIGTTESPIIVNMRSVTQKGGKTIDHLIHSTLDYRVGMIKKVTAGMLKDTFKK